MSDQPEQNPEQAPYDSDVAYAAGVASAGQPEGPSEPPSPEVLRAAAFNLSLQVYAAMQREIKSWGGQLLMWSAVGVIFGLFQKSVWGSLPWSLLLLVVAGMSFYFRESAMFVVYAVTLLWAGVFNLLNGSATWIIFALFQLWMVYTTFQSFRRYHKAEANVTANLTDEDRAKLPNQVARIFPVAGFLLGGLAALGVVTFIGVFLLEAGTPQINYPWLFYLPIAAANVAVLGLALALGALLAGLKGKVIPMALAILGLASSGLVLAAWIGFMIWIKTL